MSCYLEALRKRRSVYDISHELPLPDEELEALLADVLPAIPSAFNMQSQRMVLLLEEQHAKLWEIVLDSLRPVTPADSFPKTVKKVAGFAAGHGTLLFFDDTAVAEQHREKYPLYRDLVYPWTQQQGGMLQFAVWTAFAEKGIGASLQHYNPLIDQAVQRTWKLPPEWQLMAQMPFGRRLAMPEPKEKLPVSKRMRVFR